MTRCRTVEVTVNTPRNPEQQRALGAVNQQIEDLIHSKASLLPHVPFVIKENISEKEYYKLRMLERNWMGLHAEISAERFYPSDKTASNIIGYLGAITQKEYLSIANEIKALELLIEEEKKGQSVLFYS